MTCNHLILAQPEAGATIDYTIPTGESAKLSFGPEDISGLSLTETGALKISFADGGSLTIANFGALADAGNILYLSDGTMVDPKLLQSGLEHPLPHADNDNQMIIGLPEEGVVREITLEPGQEYVFGFDVKSPTSAETVDGKFVMTFANGGQIVLANYQEAMAFDNPPQLSMNAAICEATNQDLITTLQQLALALPVDGIKVEEEEAAEKAHHKSNIDTASLDADVAKAVQVEPAAGDETPKGESADELAALADILADVEPASGEAAKSNSGYGFNSLPGSEPLGSPNAIGALGATALKYVAPSYEQNTVIASFAAPAPQDDVPSVGVTPRSVLDETDFTAGSLVGTGKIEVNFGVDQPGSIFSNNDVTISGSLPGGALLFHGVPVVISTSGTGYVGKAGTETVFTLTMDPSTGKYVYTQILPFDHADITNPDDAINIHFGFTARDADGDTAPAYVDVTVRDDGPRVSGALQLVDETDLNANVVVTGDIAHNFGADGAGDVSATGTFTSDGSKLNGALTSHGVPVTVSLVGDTYIGTAGTQTVFTLKVEDNGAYRFELLQPLDHADSSDPNDIIGLNFGVKVTDYNGDTATTTVRILVKDDVPVIGDSVGGVDETNLSEGPLVYSNILIASFGQDTSSIVPDGAATASASGAPLTLTSAGVPVVITQTANGYTATAGAQTVFTIAINPATGAYTYTQMLPLDHPVTTNHNDVIDLSFPVKITSVDGDSDTASIKISVYDDGVDARNDINGVEEGQFITGNLVHNDTLGQDNPSVVTKVVFQGTTYVVPETGSVTIPATYGTFIIKNDGTYSYQETAANPNGNETFIYTLRDGDGDTDIATLNIRVTPDGKPVSVSGLFDVDETNLTPGPMIYTGHLNIDAGRDGLASVSTNGQFTFGDSVKNGALTHNGVPVTVTAAGNVYTGKAGTETIFTLTLNNDGTYKFHLLGTLDHADMTDPNDVIQLNFGVTVADKDGDTVDGTVVIHVHDDAPVAYDDFSGAEEDQFIAGNVLHNDELSEDIVNTVTQVIFKGQTYNVPATGSVTIAGTYGTFTMAKDGQWTYQATAEDPDGNELFTYKLRDQDGDIDTAELNIRVTKDGEPVAVTGEGIVDETNLAEGIVVTQGKLELNAGTDGYGGVKLNGQLTATGSLTSLMHHGVPVVMTKTADGYAGMAGSVKVFDIVLRADATYTFKLYETLDHANPLDPNDAIKLDFQFGITLTDADGDTVNGALTITVLDDAPVARDDFSGAEEDQFIAGNVLDNDRMSQDDGNIVTAIEFKGQTYTVPATGSVTIVGTYGTLTMAKDGHWTYQTTAEDPNGNEVFRYTLKDGEGDANKANLSIRVTPDGEPVAVTGEGIVDETNLTAGIVVTNGKLVIDAGMDGYGSVKPNGTFLASGSLTDLKHQGIPVVVTKTADGYVGMAGAVKIFDLSLHQDATYTFKLYETLDHANPLDPNDAIKLDFQFGVTLTDADGDAVNGTLTVTVLDDAPVARDDVFCVVSKDIDFVPTISGENSLDESDGLQKITGNASVNYGGDVPGSVTGTNVFSSTYALTSNGQPVTVTYNATTHTYTGTAGGQSVFTLLVNSNGSYVFEQLKPIDHADKADQNDAVDLMFGVKATDGDGDVGTGNIKIKILDDGPSAIADVHGAKLEKSVITGNVLANDDVGTDVGAVVTGVRFGGLGFVTVPAVGELTFNGQYGVLKIKANGDYTYVSNSVAQNVTETFTYRMQDGDGDTDTETLSFQIIDADTAPKVVNAFDQVDETNGFDTVSGKVTVDFGDDSPSQVTGTGAFSSSYALKSGGVAVAVTYNATTGVYTGKAGTKTVFTMDVNADGTYTFKQYDQLDHALKGLNGVNHNDALDLVFGVKATDADGDVGTATATIRVLDDGPIARNDSISVIETTLIAGAYTTTKADDKWVRVNVLANDTIGADNGSDYQITKAVFANGQTSMAVGAATYFVRVSADGRAVEVHGNRRDGDYKQINNILNITYTVKDSDGDTDTAQLVVKQIDNTSPIVLDLDGDGIELTDVNNGAFFDMVTDGGIMDQTAWVGKDDGLLAIDTNKDGRITDRTELFGDTEGYANGFIKLADYDSNSDNKIDANDERFNDLIVWKDVNTDGVSQEGEMFKLAELGISSINVNAALTDYYINGQWVGAESTFIMNGQTRTVVDAWFNVIDGNSLVDAAGANVVDGASATNVIKASVLHNDTLSQDDGNAVTAVVFGGTTYTVPANGTVTINGLYGTLIMGSDGKFTYTAKDDIQTEQIEVFTYHLKDYEGDKDTAELKLCVKPAVADDKPAVVDVSNAVDETGGFDTVSGTVTVNYGGDGPGTVTGTNVFTSSYALKSCGVPVVVTYNATTGIYTGMAGARTVFTMDIDANGAYTFKQLDQLDHANVSDPNDAVNLVFGVKATDADGDVGTGNITITVRDDGPVANDDNGGDVNAGATKIGNVLTNDVVGADADGRVIIVNFNGTSVTIPSTSTGTVINGTNGVLTMKGDGSYSYVAKAAGNGVDNFTYTLKDCDGDTDPAILSFCVKPIVLDPPVVTVNNGVNDVCVKEDGQVTVPVRASYAGGDGDEVMTLTLKGATVAGWTVTAPGWTKVGADWVITLPAGQKSYAGNVTFKPPANKDTDIPNLSVEAKLYDPDTAKTATSTDTFRVITDAVADGSNLTVPGSAVYVQKPDLSSAVTTTGAWGLTYTTYTKYITTKVADGSIYLRYGVDTSPLSLGISLNDKDGSEAVTKIVLTYRPDVTGQEMTFNKGTKIALNKWEIPVANGDVATALKNLTLKVDQDTRTSEKVFNSGKLSVAVYSQEKNLSGAECNLADNTHVETKVIDFYARYSPLALDMDRDGVELVSIHNGVQFDMNNDGDKENVGWVAKDDALLAIDLNRDGVINNQSELFGNTDTLDNGFANLAQYDSNEDGVIDVKDAAFKDLIVWQDADTDGVSDAGEMVTLDQAGITSISLDAQGADREVEGNWISHESTFTRADGSTGEIVDAWFAAKEGNIDLFSEANAADSFLFTAIGEAVQTVQTLDAADASPIDLTAMLDGQDGVSESITDFVHMRVESAQADATTGDILPAVDAAQQPMVAGAQPVDAASLDVSGLIDQNGTL